MNLLQCKPGDYNVTNTFNMVKERLGSYLTSDELYKLECTANEKELEKQRSQSSSFFKIPIFQPTAAAAMMYNMQNATIKKKNIEDAEKEYIMSNSIIKNEDYDRLYSIKKETGVDIKPKLFSYIFQQCKRDVWLCDSQTQFDVLNLNENDKIILSKNSINVFDVNECNNKSQQFKLNKLDSWTDIDVKSINY